MCNQPHHSSHLFGQLSLRVSSPLRFGGVELACNGAEHIRSAVEDGDELLVPGQVCDNVPRSAPLLLKEHLILACWEEPDNSVYSAFLAFSGLRVKI